MTRAADPEEWIDVLDAGGKPTGETKPKPAIHRDGDLHRSAHLWIVTARGRVLLQKRSASKKSYPGRWDVSVAGHLAAGETAVEAAIREASEEIGLALAPEELRHLGTLRERCEFEAGRWVENEIHEVFLARRDLDLGSLVPDPEEVEELVLVEAAGLEAYDPVPHPGQFDLLFRALGLLPPA